MAHIMINALMGFNYSNYTLLQVDMLRPMIVEGVQIFVINAFVINTGNMNFFAFAFQFTNDSSEFSMENKEVMFCTCRKIEYVHCVCC